MVFLAAKKYLELYYLNEQLTDRMSYYEDISRKSITREERNINHGVALGFKKAAWLLQKVLDDHT